MRRLAGGVAIGVVLVACAGYAAWTSGAAGGSSAAAAGPGTLVFLDGRGELSRVDRGGTARLGVRCLRSYTARGTTVCLRPVAIPAGFEAAILRGGKEVAEPIRIDGTPSRARVSPSGRLAAWTVFRSGDSYDPGAFATTTGVYDTRTGALHGSLEDFAVTVDGRPYRREDRNFWGVTFAGDDETFYVTMGSAGKVRLMRGRLGARSLSAVAEGVECPSLSPDGTRVAYKKRSGDRWRLHVMDLASLRQTPLAETGDVDDQAEWLDDATVAYGRNGSVLAVPADGGGTPRLVRRGATAPAMQR
ncbi:hypothetical protein [Nonomuraea typhae]|uniref:TolB-like translocation protein n=1 Tax=Nonomuraea typhae TaxID=2603600 RepID=A0ABW7YNW9_9ACTN